MLTGYFKSNKPLVGLSLLILPMVFMPLWTMAQPLGWDTHMGLALCSGVMAQLVNLFLIHRSGYIKTSFLLGWIWWIVLLGLSRSGHGIDWMDLFGSLMSTISIGFVFTLHRPIGNKDLVALNIGLLGAFASWIRPDALIVLPFAWLGLGIYGHLNLRRVLVSLLPLAGTWAIVYPVIKYLGGPFQAPEPVALFADKLLPTTLPYGWGWSALCLAPLLLQSVAALSKAKRIKRSAIQLSLGTIILLLIWSLAFPMAWIWIPGGLSVPLALLTANAIDYTQKGWLRAIWIFGYVCASLYMAWGTVLDINPLAGIIF